MTTAYKLRLPEGSDINEEKLNQLIEHSKNTFKEIENLKYDPKISDITAYTLKNSQLILENVLKESDKWKKFKCFAGLFEILKKNKAVEPLFLKSNRFIQEILKICNYQERTCAKGFANCDCTLDPHNPNILRNYFLSRNHDTAQIKKETIAFLFEEQRKILALKLDNLGLIKYVQKIAEKITSTIDENTPLALIFHRNDILAASIELAKDPTNNTLQKDYAQLIKDIQTSEGSTDRQTRGMMTMFLGIVMIVAGFLVPSGFGLPLVLLGIVLLFAGAHYASSPPLYKQDISAMNKTHQFLKATQSLASSESKQATVGFSYQNDQGDTELQPLIQRLK